MRVWIDVINGLTQYRFHLLLDTMLEHSAYTSLPIVANSNSISSDNIDYTNVNLTVKTILGPISQYNKAHNIIYCANTLN